MALWNLFRYIIFRTITLTAICLTGIRNVLENGIIFHPVLDVVRLSSASVLVWNVSVMYMPLCKIRVGQLFVFFNVNQLYHSWSCMYMSVCEVISEHRENRLSDGIMQTTLQRFFFSLWFDTIWRLFYKYFLYKLGYNLYDKKNVTSSKI